MKKDKKTQDAKEWQRENEQAIAQDNVQVAKRGVFSESWRAF